VVSGTLLTTKIDLISFGLALGFRFSLVVLWSPLNIAKREKKIDSTVRELSLKREKN
jgi:hypothetical protein